MRRGRPEGGRFEDRRDAGRQLATALAERDLDHPVVIALPRGGVPVAAEIAARLDAPLDVVIVRKLGLPEQPELGIAAIGEGGLQVRNDRLIERLGVTEEALAHIAAREQAEVERRARRYRGDHPAAPVAGRTVIVVDDGIATGSTARAAVQVLRTRQPAQIVLAVPVAPPTTVERLRHEVDDVVCLRTPVDLVAIGRWYVDFTQVSDGEVTTLLARHRVAVGASTRRGPAAGSVRDVRVPVGTTVLPGVLTVPDAPVGVVIFAHGSGSGRRSPRNAAVARTLRAAGLATLLFDLLDDDEAVDRRKVFDIRLLAERLVAATRWLEGRPEVKGLPVGYFGASTGAAAALVAAAWHPTVAAVVSRGGRPDLAREWLDRVRAPTLLIVGGLDEPVVERNRQARIHLGGHSQLVVVPGATHLFVEPGALERVATLARNWFTGHLTGESRIARPRASA